MLTPQQWHARFLQQARWTAPARRTLSAGLGILRGTRGLEVGCGSGVIAAETRSASGAGVHAVDIRLDFLQMAHEWDPGLRLSQADALHLPFACGSFDFSFCHFFLLWVAEPGQALREMRRVTRPGGAVFAAAEPDYGGRLDFPVELARLGQLQSESLRRQGADPWIGRRLTRLLHDAGLVNVRSRVLGGQWGESRSDAEIRSEWETLLSDLAGLVTADEMSNYQELDRRAWESGERILYIPTFYAWGFVP